jgi:Fe-Mn family superoxide dismutase
MGQAMTANYCGIDFKTAHRLSTEGPRLCCFGGVELVLQTILQRLKNPSAILSETDLIRSVIKVETISWRKDEMAHELPPLPYDYSALEPVIDAATMKLHHDMHHAAYVKNLNAALEKHPELQSKSAEDLIRDLNAIPEDIRGAVRNNGGGHVNHSMFWKIMKPKGGGDPTGAIGEAITKAFGNLKDFQTKFNDAGVKQFGSGWVWLAAKPSGEVQILSTPNQDNPISQGLFPIFGNDVWEHAYYLKYNNRRPEYLAAWWNAINWDEINKRYASAKSGK